MFEKFENTKRPFQRTVSTSAYWDMIKELDAATKEYDFTDWELKFVSDMMDKVNAKEPIVGNQGSHIERLYEKYIEGN